MRALAMSAVAEALRGSRIVALGAGGVIGGRVVEALAGELGVETVAVVRTLSKAARAARFPIRIVSGDVRDAGILDRAISEGDIVVDLTYPAEGNRAERVRAAREMADSIAAAVRRRRARRLVHLSTISVYGPVRALTLDESAPRRPGADPYGAGKQAGERELLRLAREDGLPAVILQPTVVYGPFAGWTVGPLRQLREGIVVLPARGQGICNAVYLDDVIQAIFRAAVAEAVEGEAFLISGEQPPTWLDFYGAYERMLGVSSLLAMDTASVRAQLNAQAKSARPFRRLIHRLRSDGDLRQTILALPALAQAYALARALLPRARWERAKDRWMKRGGAAPSAPGRPLRLPRPIQLELMASPARVSIEKARRRLGFEPAYDLDQGMRATREWAAWAGLIPE